MDGMSRWLENGDGNLDDILSERYWENFFLNGNFIRFSSFYKRSKNKKHKRIVPKNKKSKICTYSTHVHCPEQ